MSTQNGSNTQPAAYKKIKCTQDSKWKLKLDIIKRRQQINTGQWGLVRGQIRPTRYDKLVRMIAGINHQLCDTKVSTDTKRILRLPSTLHYKVSMKCMAVKNIEYFDPFKSAVPHFVIEKEEL